MAPQHGKRHRGGCSQKSLLRGVIYEGYIGIILQKKMETTMMGILGTLGVYRGYIGAIYG